MNGINWELSLIDQVNLKRGCEKEQAQKEPRANSLVPSCAPKATVKSLPKTVVSSTTVKPPERPPRTEPASKKQTGLCPACRSSLSFNIRGHANAEGICPNRWSSRLARVWPIWRALPWRPGACVRLAAPFAPPSGFRGGLDV